MKDSNLRLVFMGSPDFAVPALRALAERFSVVGVVTQPDRPAGRGRTLTPPPVKILADELGLPSIQPEKLRLPEPMEQLKAWAPELIVVAAYGQILKPAVLELPAYGCINIHASLLPRWRGAAPISAAILHGDAQTGITIMCMESGVDTGPIISQRDTPIGPHETAGGLAERLASLGAELIIETLPGYLNGSLKPKPQDGSAATYAPMLKKEDGELNFNRPAVELERLVRAFQPWPGAFMLWQGQLLKIQRAGVAHLSGEKQPPPGQRMLYKGLPAISTVEGLLVLEEIQPAGKKPMPGKVFLQGARNWM